MKPSEQLTDEQRKIANGVAADAAAEWRSFFSHHTDCEGTEELMLAADIERAILQALDELVPEMANDAARYRWNGEVCDTCHGTGQVCVGTSGKESDGNALEFECCPECGYGD